MKGIRVFIVDDNFVARRGLRSVLEAEEGIIVAGEASSGIEALKRLQDCETDVVLMDVRMPEIDGVETTVQLLREKPGIRVLLATVIEDPAVHMNAMLAGACGYLVYGHFSVDELVQAVRTVAEGRCVSIPPVPLQQETGSAVMTKSLLTQREEEILKLIAAGKDNREIAANLDIEEKTVKNHINSIYSKLGVAGRKEAIYYTLDRQLRK
jgi:DNA-binding NarL/FixJ family response regulator